MIKVNGTKRGAVFFSINIHLLINFSNKICLSCFSLYVCVINNKSKKQFIMKNNIKISDFSFQIVAFGRYQVTYTSPVTSKQFTAMITDMTLIDATKNEDTPRRCDLNELKRVCKLLSK